MEYIGSERVWNSPKAAILNSRQSKFPLGSDRWVVSTGRAVASLHERDWALVTSLGLKTWELSLAFAARLGLPAIIIIPEQIDERASFMADICRRFGLSGERTAFGFLEEPSGIRPKKTWPVRDAAVAQLADRLLPVSIRPGGKMAALVEANRHKVDFTFGTPYDTGTRPRPRYDAAILNPAIDWKKWLIHFTRSSDGPWPDETDLDFYSGIIASTEEYCRSARRTLAHILKTGTIRGSAARIRGGFSVVPLAEVTPDSVSCLFRYRPRLLNPGLEPFGIAVTRQAAASLGIRPVLYGTPDLYDRLPKEAQPFFQHRGGFDSQWMIEHEWRHQGDLPLGRIPPESLRIVVPTAGDIPSPQNAASPSVSVLFT